MFPNRARARVAICFALAGIAGIPAEVHAAPIPTLTPDAKITGRCGSVRVMVGTPDGTIWIRGGARGTVCRSAGARLQPVSLAPPVAQSSGTALVIGPGGRPWFEYHSLGQLEGLSVNPSAGVARINQDLSVSVFPLPTELTQAGIVVGYLSRGRSGSLILPATIPDIQQPRNPRRSVKLEISPQGTYSPAVPYDDLFADPQLRRLEAFGPEGNIWAALPTKRLIVDPGAGSGPASRITAPPAFRTATWFAIGSKGRIWFGTKNVASSWKAGEAVRSVRVPPHPGLFAPVAAVLPDGRVAIGLWRRPAGAGRPTAFILGTDGSRQQLKLEGQTPWSFLSRGTRLFVGTDRGLLRFSVGSNTA